LTGDREGLAAALGSAAVTAQSWLLVPSAESWWSVGNEQPVDGECGQPPVGGEESAAIHEPFETKHSLKPVINLYGDTPAAWFGPLQLTAVRDQVIGQRLVRN
jgi:hypothetical protein